MDINIYMIGACVFILAGLSMFGYLQNEIGGWLAWLGCAPLMLCIVGAMMFALQNNLF